MPFPFLCHLMDARSFSAWVIALSGRPNHLPTNLVGSRPLYNKFIPRCFCYFFPFFLFLFYISLLISARPENWYPFSYFRVKSWMGRTRYRDFGSFHIWWTLYSHVMIIEVPVVFLVDACFLFPFYSLARSLCFLFFSVSTLSFYPRIMRGLLHFPGAQLRPGNYRTRPSFSSLSSPI